jgi:hypothetical protein
VASYAVTVVLGASAPAEQHQVGVLDLVLQWWLPEVVGVVATGSQPARPSR